MLKNFVIFDFLPLSNAQKKKKTCEVKEFFFRLLQILEKLSSQKVGNFEFEIFWEFISILGFYGFIIYWGFANWGKKKTEGNTFGIDKNKKDLMKQFNFLSFRIVC